MMTPFQRETFKAVLADMDNWSHDQLYDYAVERREQELKNMSFFSLVELAEKIRLEKEL